MSVTPGAAWSAQANVFFATTPLSRSSAVRSDDLTPPPVVLRLSMAVLLLSPYSETVIDALIEEGDVVTIVDKPLDLAGARERDAAWMVSY